MDGNHTINRIVQNQINTEKNLLTNSLTRNTISRSYLKSPEIRTTSYHSITSPGDKSNH
jgi:hypothetical protein